MAVDRHAMGERKKNRDMRDKEREREGRQRDSRIE
jgi:hypothetical protein